jgi:hypothetical protein
MTIPATNPASKPAEIAFVLLTTVAHVTNSPAQRKPNCQNVETTLSARARKAAMVPLLVRWRENFPHALNNYLGRDLFHTRVIKRALAQATIIARRTRQIHSDNRFRPFVRADMNRIRRSEDTDHRFAQRRGDVH